MGDPARAVFKAEFISHRGGKPKMPKKATSKPTNYELIPGLNRYGRSASYARKGKWAVKSKKPSAKKTAEKKAVVKTFGKKKEQRTIRSKEFKWYSADDV